MIEGILYWTYEKCLQASRQYGSAVPPELSTA
jgi:hypothetical protein